MTELHDLLDIARQAARLGADLWSSSAPGRVEAKSERDFVTGLDVGIQGEIQRYLAARTPGIGFLGEEGDAGPAYVPARRWVLDPIDGTSNSSTVSRCARYRWPSSRRIVRSSV